MKWLLGTYTKRFNIRHKLCGHLFAGRYKVLIVEGSGTGYLRVVCDYVHLNPVRAKLLKPEVPLESFVWSSYPEYLKAPQERPRWLRVDRLLGEKGIPRDSDAGRKEFARQMEQRRAEEAAVDYRQLRRDGCLGSEEFRKELLAAATERVGPNHYGSDRRESAEQKARRIVSDGLNLLGWDQASLESFPKGHTGKVELARQLRSETTMSLKWIAQELKMGSWTYVSNLLVARNAKEFK